MKGIVKKIVEGKGFGFITPENGAKDVFFHTKFSMAQGVNFDDIKENDAVTFDTEESDKGTNAVNVTKA